MSVSYLKVYAQENTAALSILAQIRQAADVIKAPSSYPKDSVLQSVAEAQAVAGDIKSAFQTVSAIQDEDAKAFPLVIIGLVQVATGDLIGAQQTTSKITSAFYRAQALTAVAAAQAKAGNLIIAKETFNKAVQVAITLNADISELGTPKDATLSGIAIAQMQSGCPIEAMKTVGLLKDREQANTLVELGRLQSDRDMEGAAKIVENLSDGNDKARVLTAIAKVEFRANNGKDAWNHLNQARQLAVSGDVWQEIAEAPTAGGDIKNAIEIANTIKWKGLRNESIKAIVVKQFTAGDVEGAVQNAIMYSDQAVAAVVGAQAKAGDVKGARKTAESIKSKFFKDLALRDIALAEVTQGNAQNAVEISSSINDGNYRNEVLEVVVKDKVKLKDTESALQLVKGVKWEEMKARLMSVIAKTQAEIGEVVAAQRTADNIEDGCVRPDALRGVAVAQVKSGDAKGAIAWALKSSTDNQSAILVAVTDDIKETLPLYTSNREISEFHFFELSEPKGCY